MLRARWHKVGLKLRARSVPQKSQVSRIMIKNCQSFPKSIFSLWENNFPEIRVFLGNSIFLCREFHFFFLWKSIFLSREFDFFLGKSIFFLGNIYFFFKKSISLCQEIDFFLGKLSGHISSLLWPNVSKVTSLLAHSVVLCLKWCKFQLNTNFESWPIIHRETLGFPTAASLCSFCWVDTNQLCSSPMN